MMGDEEFKEEMKMYGEQSKSSLLMSTTNAPRFNLYEDDYAEGDQEEDITLSGQRIHLEDDYIQQTLQPKVSQRLQAKQLDMALGGTNSDGSQYR